MIDTGSPMKRRLVFTGAGGSCDGGWPYGDAAGYSCVGNGRVWCGGCAGGSYA
jgi:hypothetical protein